MSGRIRQDAPPLGGEPETAIPPPPPPRPTPAPPPEPPPPAAAAPAAGLPPEQEPLQAPAEAPREAPPEPEQLSTDLKGRLDRLTREKFEARLRAEEAERRLAEYERQRQQPQSYQGQPAQPDTLEQAREQVRQEERQRQFNAACNDLYTKGRQEFGEGMDEAVRSLNAVGFGNRPDALAAITNLPDGHKVYRALAGDMENASRILSLPPMAMAVELARLSLGGHAANGTPAAPPMPPPAATQAPEPRAPIGGHPRAPARPLNQMSMAEFIRTRDREERLGSRISR
jgi:hypothetical protein